MEHLTVSSTTQHSECTFCTEFANPENSDFRSIFSQQELESRIISKSQNFTSLVALGALREGYILVLPNKHIQSFAFLNESLAEEAERFLNENTVRIESHYSRTVVFEHGVIDVDKLRAGGCIDHAHLHIFPTDLDLFSILKKRFHFKPIKDLRELSYFREKRKQYLYLRTAEESVAFMPETTLPSQYLRQLIFKGEGRQDEWDWGLFLGKEYIIRTVQNLANE